MRAPENAAATGGKPAAARDDDAVISALVTAEETCLILSPKMRALSKGLLELRLPGSGTGAVFAASVSVSDIGLLPGFKATDDSLVSRLWPLEESAKQVSKVDLWRPLLDAVSTFEHAKVYVITGEHPNGDMFRFEAQAGFDALALMKAGEWRSLHGKMKLNWERSKDAQGTPGEWQMTGWKTEEMHWSASPKRLFVEALDTALRGPQEAAKLRRSLHYEATVQHYRDGMKTLPHPYFAPISVNQKEGIAVADVNGDGFDDIYVTVRIGRNMLLVNQRDGTFVEQAALYKLDLPGHTTCALFADFDNDGDLDVILGRSLLKTSYLENRQGSFYQHPIPTFMPMAVISMAAADYNRDGLLDVYLCTYRPAAPMGASPAGGVAQIKEGDFDWPDEFFSPEMAREYRRRLAEHRQHHGGTVLDQIGPPNVLLINRGGGSFEPAPENSAVGIWRNSLQATWGDYDLDGDPDLFVANDWAPSNLFRNDGPTGFTDVTEEAGVTSYGFSMGASWGDYDNDGLEDVYVSNMYSAPGRRMTARIPGLSKMFGESAAGNWLYRQTAKGKFQQVSGMEPPAMTVMNAGWSWGGCFADFDNDAFLDLYVLSGYFTAPRELSSELDLESNLWRTMLRTDENLSRASFRFSPEWKRTRAPDNLGPQIDARLAGVERQGDKILVHSLNGNERNHYFANRGGRSFVDISALSGLDNPADSRGFAVLDYDHDGWQDIALVNANQPLFNLYHNEMPSVGVTGGMIAIRFVGGNRTAGPSREFACRDGYGARVKVDLGETKLIREHRCGDGWSTQNSATMIVGIGSHTNVASITVQWPSGKTASARAIPEGTHLTVYENRADSPSKTAFVGAYYRAKPR
jgi:ASPIC/UnbV protein/VCBS repeat protein